MKKILFSLAMVCGLSVDLVAQQGMVIGDTPGAANSSAILEVRSNNVPRRGFLPPRMTSTARNSILTPAAGLQVYQTDGDSGFYVYRGSVWLKLLDSTSAVRSVNNISGSVNLVAGTNVSIAPSGNTLTISSTGGALTLPSTTLGFGSFTINNASNSGNGISGLAKGAAPNAGVYGESSTLGQGYGVYGRSTESWGVYGESTTGIGVVGSSLGSYGVQGFGTSGATGVYGLANGTGVGVRGEGSSSGFSGELGTASHAVYANGPASGVSAWFPASDARFKKNILSIDKALAKVLRLRGVEFDWRNDEFPKKNFAKTHQIGFIAQEIKEVLPEVVMQDEEGYFSVAYSTVVPVLVEALKEQQQQIEALRQQVVAAKSENIELSKLKKEMDVMKSALQRLGALPAAADEKMSSK